MENIKHNEALKLHSLSNVPAQHTVLFSEIKKYLTEFLVSEHPFRSGNVCPYMGDAIKRDKVWLSEAKSQQDTEKLINDSMQVLKDASYPNSVSVIVLDKNINVKSLRENFDTLIGKILSSGYMFAIFGPKTKAHSEYSDDYFPFDTPNTVVVIRPMTIQDFDLINTNALGERSRINFLSGYLHRFSSSKNLATHTRVEKAKLLLNGNSF